MQSLFLDAKGKFNGEARYFWAANEVLETSLRDSGLLWVLNDEILDPTKPTRADERLTANIETSADLNSIERYESKTHINHEKYERAYNIVKNFLGSTTLARVQHIVHDKDLSLRKKSQNIMKHLKETLGKMSTHDATRIEADIAALPAGVDDISATRLVDELVEDKVIMKKSGQPISERDLLNKLKSKLSGPAFIRVYDEIDQNNDMTFDNACEKIRSAIQTYKRMKETFYSNSSSSTSTKRKFDNIQYPEYVTQNSLNGDQFVNSIKPWVGALGGGDDH
jgi:hypothetical protein